MDGSRDTFRTCIEQLPEGIAARIETVTIDMTTAYELGIKAQCPQAEIIIDLYRVAAKFYRKPAWAKKAWEAMIRTGSGKRDGRPAKVRRTFAGLLAWNRDPNGTARIKGIAEFLIRLCQ